METLYLISIPSIILGSYIYIQNNNITKKDCIQCGLNQVNNVYNGYKYVEKNINNYIKYNYKDLETIRYSKYIGGIKEILYHYNEKSYMIIYDTQYPINKNLVIGDMLDSEDILIESKSNNMIVLTEYIHINTGEIVITDELLNKRIKQLAGPNSIFYNRDKQKIYIPSTLIKNKDILENIEKYNIQITYMNLNILQKQLIII